MKVCEICGRKDTQWEPGFAFMYTLSDDSEHYYCPECTEKRLKELADKENKDD